jgi:hypothetical protein
MQRAAGSGIVALEPPANHSPNFPHREDARMHTGTRTLLRSPGAALIVYALGALFAGAPAAADDGTSAPALAPGLRVRIEAPGLAPTDATGTIRAIDDKTIRLEVPGRAEPVDVARAQITRFQVSGGRSSRLVHTLVGAAIGAIGGAVIASHSGGQDISGTHAAATVAVALVGAGIGAALPAGERWSDLPAARYRVALVPNPGAGFGFLFSRGF